MDSKQFLAKIDSNLIYLEESIYIDLQKIIDTINSKSTKFAD